MTRADFIFFIMETVTLYNVDQRVIDAAADALRRGELVVYPTDSHPALAADSLSVSSISALCRAKGVNPDKHTLTLVCDSIATAAQYARIDNHAFAIIKRNAPGPFTFILPPAQALPKVYKNRKEVGVRIPANDIARALAAELGRPLLSGSIGDADPSAYERIATMQIIDGISEYLEPQSSAIVSLIDSSAPEILREGPRELN